VTEKEMRSHDIFYQRPFSLFGQLRIRPLWAWTLFILAAFNLGLVVYTGAKWIG
jgi:hypothetical protein